MTPTAPRQAMRFVVESWAPEYGAPADEAALAAGDLKTGRDVVDLAVEVPPDGWAPRSPPPATVVPDRLLFVDGVRRIDARVWIAADDGRDRQGICASYAAGVVRCDGRAEVTVAEVRRALFSPAVGATPIDTRHGTYRHVPVAGDDPDQLSLCLQQQMADLEHRVSVEAGADPGRVQAGEPALVVVDGPLRERHRIGGAVGYVKTHQRAYLPPAVAGTVDALAAGQRTPLFQIGGRFSRWSWYLRLPGEAGHAWAGVVRLEASTDLSAGEATALADITAAALPRFASTAHKDARAPQNLFPIGGLERHLRHRLGDPALLYRGLRRAAAGVPG
ncbi:hypothetical protein BH20ACT2_BH20ACT2_09630 [soil metagenome]